MRRSSGRARVAVPVRAKKPSLCEELSDKCEAQRRIVDSICAWPINDYSLTKLCSCVPERVAINIKKILIFHIWNVRACISNFFQNKSAMNLSAFLQPFSFPKFKGYIKSFLYCDIFKEWYTSFQMDDSGPKWTGKCSFFRALLYVNAYTEVLRGLI